MEAGRRPHGLLGGRRRRRTPVGWGPRAEGPRGSRGPQAVRTESGVRGRAVIRETHGDDRELPRTVAELGLRTEKGQCSQGL